MSSLFGDEITVARIELGAGTYGGLFAAFNFLACFDPSRWDFKWASDEVVIWQREQYSADLIVEAVLTSGTMFNGSVSALEAINVDPIPNLPVGSAAGVRLNFKKISLNYILSQIKYLN